MIEMDESEKSKNMQLKYSAEAKYSTLAEFKKKSRIRALFFACILHTAYL